MNGADKIQIFVRIVAVLVGVLNAIMYSMAGDTVIGEPQTFSWDLEPWPLTALYVLAASVAGLLVSEVFLRFVRRGLRGDFYTRHLTMVLAVCAGGMLLGALLASVSALADDAIPMTDRLVGVLIAAPITGIVGGWLGFAEGLLFGFPLAAALGLFGDRD